MTKNARKHFNNKSKDFKVRPMNPVLTEDQFRQPSRLKKLVDLVGDGEDHINIYKNPKTEIGKIFSPLVDFHFTIPVHGRFASRQGLRQYLLSSDGDENYRRMPTFKMRAYSAARNNSLNHYPNLEFFMVQALVAQITANQKAIKLIKENNLPFDAYYMSRHEIQGVPNMFPTRPFDAVQMIEIAEHVADAIKNDTEVDLSIFIDDSRHLEMLQSKIIQQSIPDEKIENVSEEKPVENEIQRVRKFDYPFLNLRLLLDRKIEVTKIEKFLDSKFGQVDEVPSTRVGLGRVTGFIRGAGSVRGKIVRLKKFMNVYDFQNDFLTGQFDELEQEQNNPVDQVKEFVNDPVSETTDSAIEESPVSDVSVENSETDETPQVETEETTTAEKQEPVEEISENETLKAEERPEISSAEPSSSEPIQEDPKATSEVVVKDIPKSVFIPQFNQSL